MRRGDAVRSDGALDPGCVVVDHELAARVELVATERQVVRDQKLAGRPRGDAQIEECGGPMRGTPRTRFDDSVVETIDPARIGGRHRERRGHAELAPLAALEHEDAHAAGARDVEVVPDDRQQAREVGIPDVHLGGEDPGGVARHAEMAGIDRARLAASEDVAVRAQHRRFLGVRHDVRVGAMKEAEQGAVVSALLMASDARKPRVPVGRRRRRPVEPGRVRDTDVEPPGVCRRRLTGSSARDERMCVRHHRRRRPRDDRRDTRRRT